MEDVHAEDLIAEFRKQRSKGQATYIRSDRTSEENIIPIIPIIPYQHTPSNMLSYSATSSPMSMWSTLSSWDMLSPPSPSTRFLSAPPTTPTWGLLDVAPLAPWVLPIEVWVQTEEQVEEENPVNDARLERLENSMGSLELRALLRDDTQQVQSEVPPPSLFGRPGQAEAEHLECPQDSWAMAQDAQEVQEVVPWVERGGDEEACWVHCFRCRSISHKVAQCPKKRKVQCICGSRSHRMGRCPRHHQQVQEEEALQCWVTAMPLDREECRACNKVGRYGFIARHECHPMFAEETLGLVSLPEADSSDDNEVTLDGSVSSWTAVLD